jgi:hypothetical protein
MNFLQTVFVSPPVFSRKDFMILNNRPRAIPVKRSSVLDDMFSNGGCNNDNQPYIMKDRTVWKQKKQQYDTCQDSIREIRQRMKQNKIQHQIVEYKDNEHPQKKDATKNTAWLSTVLYKNRLKIGISTRAE